MFDCDLWVPRTLTELTQMLNDPTARILAGGTDLIPRMQRSTANLPKSLIDISHLQELRYIQQREDCIEIGALTSHAELLSSPLLLQSTPALTEACASIGAPQTRARGTLGGNLANASPAADSAVALLALDAQIVLSSTAGDRQMPLADFFIGPGKTELQVGEFIHHVRIPLPGGIWGSTFLKLGRRKGMAVAVASSAVYLELNGTGKVQCIRAAFGSVSPTPVRSAHVENALLGCLPSPENLARAADTLQVDIFPISDIRASSQYRRHSAQVLLERALQKALLQAGERML